MTRTFSARKLSCAIFIAGFIALAACGGQEPPQTDTDKPATGNMMSMEELMAMPKIEAHSHIVELDNEGEAKFFGLLERHNMKWLTIATRGSQWSRSSKMIDSAVRLTPLYPSQLAWITTFNLENWGEPDWEDQTLATIEQGFERGAVGVKVWKEIGMVIKDPDSSFVMIDDPRFDPIFRFVAAHGKTVLAHIGEPRSCWLPLDSTAANFEQGYYARNPQYHAYLHPEIPHYWEHIAARDSVLARHPNLRMVGAHLGSLEWDVDSLARRLELYPNFAVDMSGRIRNLQAQDRDKVREFFIKYQDRVMYATDIIASTGPGTDLDKVLERMEKTYLADYRYFATDEQISVSKVGSPINGLALPAEVLVKVFRENARKWYPGIGTVGANTAYAVN
jgi:predicted TIM-barrel fold metal-dependent hydrolase